MDSAELQEWFENLRRTLEASYTAYPASQPWRQSGMSGPQERWTSLRRPLADCLDRSSSFLDIGCANGYLLECLLGWAGEGGLQVEPYGLDISARLVELARQRLDHYSDHFFTANAFDWIPPQRFDFVRTELVYVPAEYERAFVSHLFNHYLKPDGRLIIASYMEGMPDPQRGCLPGCFATADILGHLADLHIHPIAYYDGYDPLKDRRTRFAVVDRAGLK
jgi:SAM-dependent methyltransferase